MARAIAHAYTTADLRARGDLGWSNRAMRAHQRRRDRDVVALVTPEGHLVVYRRGSIAYCDGGNN